MRKRILTTREETAARVLRQAKAAWATTNKALEEYRNAGHDLTDGRRGRKLARLVHAERKVFKVLVTVAIRARNITLNAKADRDATAKREAQRKRIKANVAREIAAAPSRRKAA